MSTERSARWKGPPGALFVGMLYERGPGVKDSLTLSTYKPQLIDLGKLDALSPPWQRLSAGAGAPTGLGRSSLASERFANLLKACASYHAHAAALESGLGAAAKICCELAPSRALPNQIALVVAARLGRPSAEDASWEGKSAEEKAHQWSKCFFIKFFRSLRSKPGACSEWASGIEGLQQSMLRSALGLAQAEDGNVAGQWAPALLAFEESLELDRMRLPARAAKAAPKKKRL